ncbi:MAG: flagellar hook-associated protein FlgK [Sandaracinaceae bacterium]
MSLFGLLSSGATGIHAQGFGMQVTAQNAQNANTEGYSRRDVRLNPLAPPPDGGGGVQVRGSRRVMDTLLERRVLGATSARAQAEAEVDGLSVLDRVLADVEGGLGPSLDDFEVALTQLAGRPSDSSVRINVLAKAESLSQAFSTASTDLTHAREDLDSRIALEVDEVNGMLGSIADLGVQIQRAEIGGAEASDLRDQRDQQVRELSEKLPISTVEGRDGSMSVLLGGSLALVTSDGQYTPLSATRDATSGDMTITRRTAGQDQDVSRLVDSGSLGGYIAARDGSLADAEAALDQLAFDIAAAYNAAHQSGVGSDGVGGRDLFSTTATPDGAAAAFIVSTDVLDNEAAIGAGADPALPGDNRNALLLAGVADEDTSLGGTGTAQEALGSMIAVAGIAIRGAQNEASARADAAAQLTAMRDSVSGVSVDEEMINLSRFQRGYQASLRVVQTADEMLAELMQMKR